MVAANSGQKGRRKATAEARYLHRELGLFWVLDEVEESEEDVAGRRGGLDMMGIPVAYHY